MTKHPLIYIGGPEVFIPDPAGFFELVKEKAKELGMVALSPYSPNIPLTENAVFNHDMNMMELADGMVAHVDPFRGSEPDSGTVWEMGFMRGRGKPVVSYMSDGRSQTAKHLDYFNQVDGRMSGAVEIPEPNKVMPDGMRTNFHTQPLNLMLAKSSTAIVYGGINKALERIALEFNRRKQRVQPQS